MAFSESKFQFFKLFQNFNEVQSIGFLSPKTKADLGKNGSRHVDGSTGLVFAADIVEKAVETNRLRFLQRDGAHVGRGPHGRLVEPQLESIGACVGVGGAIDTVAEPLALSSNKGGS